MNEKGHFLLEFRWVFFEKVSFINVFSLHFLDVVKLLFALWEYFCAVIKENTERIVTQNITNAVFGAVINPFFYRNVFTLWLLCFIITLSLRSLKRILFGFLFYGCIFKPVPVRVGLKQSSIEMVCEIGRFLSWALWILL